MWIVRAGAIALIFIFFGCRTVPQASPRAVLSNDQVFAMTFDRTGETLWIAAGSGSDCVLQRLRLSDRNLDHIAPISCPERMTAIADDQLLLTSGRSAWYVDPAGKTVRQRPPLRPGLRSPIVRSNATFAIATSPAGERLVKLIGNAETALTAEFRAIDSFDISPDAREFVLSADAAKGFDVGLGNTDGGGEVRWIFPDTLPERGVTWAPRGNKVTYRLESIGGTVLRTVHVPTAFQLTIDLPLTSVSAVAWEPAAERFAMALSAFDRPTWIELIRYGGEDRVMLRDSVPAFEVNLDRAGDLFLLGPAAIRYGSRLPLVVWLTDEPPFTWNPSHAALQKSALVATAVGAESSIDARFWEAIRATPWIDSSQVFVVSRKPPPPAAVFPDGTIVIAPTAGARAPRTTGRHQIVTLRPGTPREIDTAATEWIQRYLQLKK